MQTQPPAAGHASVAQDDFAPHRRHLLGLAYRMLGSWSEAEDIVQDAWLRWRTADRVQVREPRAFLSRVVTRLCLDHLKSARVQREQYVGQWLPEPLPDAEQYAGMGAGPYALDLSMALMLALERLAPAERAAFLLHDVFDVPYAEIAAILERDAAACRQLAARARARVRKARPRFGASQQDAQRLAEAFLRASRDGDLAALQQLLAEDAVLHTDGGGRKLATLRPIRGGAKIARFFAGIAHKDSSRTLAARLAWLNGMPGLVVTEPDGLPRAISLEIRDGRIAALYMVRNPDKLAHLGASS